MVVIIMRKDNKPISSCLSGGSDGTSFSTADDGDFYQGDENVDQGGVVLTQMEEWLPQ